MTDDYREFQHIHTDGYGDDKPLDVGLLRRMRKQVQSVGGFPDPCTFNERKGSGGDFPELYSAVPRTAGYHVRRIAAGAEGIRVTAPLAGGPFEASVSAGRARILVRINGDVYRSDWQDVATTASGTVIPYTFDVEGLTVRRESLCEVALVTESYTEDVVEGRGFRRSADEKSFHAETTSLEDPYGESAAVVVEGEGHDIVLYLDEDAINPWDDPGAQVATGKYIMTPTRVSGGLSGSVVTLYWISAPYGWEVRPQFNGDAPVSYWAIRAGIVPSSTRGPGKIQQGAVDALGKPVTSSAGTLYRDKPSSAWTRYPRWKEHTDDDRLTETHPFRAYNSPVTVRANIAMIGIKTDQVTDVGSFDELFEHAVDETVTVRLRIEHPVNTGGSISASQDLTVTCFPYDRSGASPFLVEKNAADNSSSATDGWTYREGQLYVGEGERQRGDLRLVSLQTMTVEITTDDFDLFDMTTDETYTASVEFEDLADDRKIVVLNTSIQQHITS